MVVSLLLRLFAYFGVALVSYEFLATYSSMWPLGVVDLSEQLFAYKFESFLVF